MEHRSKRNSKIYKIPRRKHKNKSMRRWVRQSFMAPKRQSTKGKKEITGLPQT